MSTRRDILADRGLPGGNTVLEIDPVARRYAEQIGCTPDDVTLELADLAVGVNQLPHHLDDTESALLIHRTHDDTGEVIEIDRLALDQRRGRNQLIRGTGIKPEAAFDQAMKLALFGIRRLAVDRNDVNQQRRRRQTIAGIVKCPMLVRDGRNNVGNELAQSVQHYFLPKSFLVSLAAALAATADIWAGKSKYAIRVVPRQALRFGNLLSSFRPRA